MNRVVLVRSSSMK